MFKKVVVISFIVLFISLSVGVTGYLYVKGQKPKETFTIDSVTVGDIYKKTVATGSVEPRREVLVKSQVSGLIEKIFIKAGDQVKKGQPIAKIKVVPNMMTLNSAETSLNTAKINFERAEAEYNRRKQLFEDKVISQADFVAFELDYNLKKEQLESAESYLQLVKNGSSRRITSTNTTVRATIDGKVLDVPAKEGAFVIESNNFNDGTTVASLANMNDLVFKGKIAESEVGKLKEGMELDLQIGAIANEHFKAKLEFISSKGVEDKGAIQFEIKAGLVSVKDSKNTIRAGYSASADIIIDSREKVLVLKEKNILISGDSVYVWQQLKDDFVKKVVKTGLSDDIFVEIISGLEKGDKVKVPVN